MPFTVYVEAQVTGNSAVAGDQITQAWDRALTGFTPQNVALVEGSTEKKVSLVDGFTSRSCVHSSFHVARFIDLGEATDFHLALRRQPEIRSLGLHPEIDGPK